MEDQDVMNRKVQAKAASDPAYLEHLKSLPDWKHVALNIEQERQRQPWLIPQGHPGNSVEQGHDWWGSWQGWG